MKNAFLTFSTVSKSKSAQIENFCTNLDFLIDNINNELPIVSVITGDFNAKRSKWCNKDITNSVGRKTNSLTSSAGYKQSINKPTHIVNNSFSCIDLIYCNNQNLFSNCGVGLSIFEKCHHNIIFGKNNIHMPHPPSYVRDVWNYSKVNIKNIKKSYSNF